VGGGEGLAVGCEWWRWVGGGLEEGWRWVGSGGGGLAVANGCVDGG
jgi:hypothetical protein